MGKVFTTDELYAIMRGEQQSQQNNSSTVQDARAAMNDRVSERNAQRRAEQLAGVQAKTAGYANGRNTTTAGSVNVSAGGEEKPKGAGIDLSPKQNVTGNALYDQWREAMTGRLGKDFEARMNAAEAAADPKKLQDAYRTASDEYDKAKKAESAAKEKMKTAPSDAVAEQYREGYESAKAAREAAEAEFGRSKAQLESAGVELPDTSTWGRIKHLFAGTSLERLGSDVGAMRGLYEAGQKGRTAQYQQAYDELQPQIARAQTAYDEMRKLYGEAGATAEYNALKDLQQKSDAYKKVLDENIQQRATAATSEMANSLTETGGAKLEEAKQGLSPIGRVGVDAASAGLNMLYDAALGRFGGSALTNAAMGLRSFGQTAQAAEASGADIDRQIGAGAAAAAKTVITNGLVDGLAGLYGKGAADDIIEMTVGKLGKTDAGRNALRVLAKSAGEGVEELVDAKLDPLVSLIYDNGEALKQKYGSGWQGYKEAAADDLYSALIGFTLGAAGQGVSAARGDYARANAELTGGAKADVNAAEEAAPTQQTTTEAQSAAPTQQTAPAETQAATPIQETAEATQSAQETEQHPQNPQDTDTREARPSILERARTARAQREAAEAQAIEEHSAAQIQYYEEHGWEAALPKELETKNMGKWVKARTAAILEENAARASREAKATPEAKEQAAAGKAGADYLAEAAGLSKGTEAPQTRTEAQGDNPAPAEAENVKQAGSDALNSALNLNNVETQAEAPAQAQKNTASTKETESTAINDDPAKHTPEEQARIEEYKAATDENLLNYIETVRNNPGAKIGRYSLKPVSDKAAADIKALTGVDVSGNKTVIEPRIIEHILKRHGEGGAANSSMRDVNDIARIQYVIDNYDNVEDGGRSAAYQTIKPNGKPGQAQTVKFSKAINGTYYVIEAVPDTKAKTVFVTSAYLSNKKAGDLQTANAEATRVTSETKNAQSPVYETSSRPGSPQASGVAGDVSTTSIPTTAQNVKSENQENAGGTQGRTRSGQYVLEDYEGSPKEKERGFSKNVRTDNAMEPKIRESFDTAPETYKQLANKDTLAKAEEIFARGLDEARGEVEQALGAAKSGSKLAPEMVPLARMVANELSKNGNVESARRILADVATELTAAGQLGQAGRILRDSDPNAALASIQKSIDAINAEFEKQHKRSKWRAELTEAETQEILSTDFTESGAYERIYEKVATRLGKEMPSSVLEKLTEIRRINMLLRPRTQIKNVASNVPMIGLRKGAETLSIGIQSALTKTGLMKEADRTRGWASKEQRQLARDYYEANKADINGQSNKWDMKSMLREKRTIFKGGAIEKAVSKMTGKEIDSFGEALRQVTYSCLEKGDARFVKSAFVDSLSQYCAAKGITTEVGITQEAIDFATANAMEATFKNANVIADIVNRAKRNSSPAVSAAIDVLIPFTTTPANILSLMGDYSPVGFAKLVSTDGPAARIDVISKASVGSAMLALGVALRFAGVITGGEDDDKDKAALDKATGQGTYSFPLSIGGSVSYDWAQPVGSLLAFGAEIADAVKGQEGWDSALMNAIYTAGDSALNLSLFQNIISVLRGSGKPTQQIIDAIMEGGATQLVPGLAGDIAKIIDGTVRSTYTGGNVFNDIGAKVLSTTPGFSKKLPASVNVRGEENTRGGLAARAFNMLLNPTNYTGGKRNAVDEEIYRLYDATGGTSFFPSVSPYKIEYDNKLYTMNGKDRETFQKAQGQTYYELAKPLLDSEMYKALSDEQKADVLKSIRDYALDEAKRHLVDGRGGEYSNDSWDAISALSKAGIAEYLPAAQALKDGKDGTGGSATYDAIDLLLGKYGDLSAPVRDELERKGLNVPGLRYSHALGMGAEDWYSAHEAVAEGEKTLGGTDAAKAISIYNSMEGKSDEAILNAMRAQLMPKSGDGGKQNATVRRAEAYMTAAKNNGAEGDLGEWLTLTAELKDADENGHVSKDDVEKAWANMGLGAKETYAGITLNDFYNITKSGTKSYANNPDYATQIDKIYAELYPDAPSVKAQLSGSVRTSEKADDGGKTASGVPRNRDAAADWVMKHSRAAKRRIS
jgi:hypothetical protein